MNMICDVCISQKDELMFFKSEKDRTFYGACVECLAELVNENLTEGSEPSLNKSLIQATKDLLEEVKELRLKEDPQAVTQMEWEDIRAIELLISEAEG